jgi:putative flippase GtrA
MTQLIVFCLVGLSAVCVDLTVYRFAYLHGIWTPLAKSIGFMVGTLYAYNMHRKITFKTNQKKALSFIILYSLNGAINVGMNSFMLNLCHKNNIPHAFWVAFVVATGISAISNFLGLKLVVFRKKRN